VNHTVRKARKTDQVQAVDRQRQALELRRAGLTFQQIARRLGYAHPAGAYHAVQRGLQTTLQEPADELRGLELERLDALHQAMWPRAIRGNVWAVDRVLSIMQRRARLLGLDAPRRLAVSGEITLQTFAEHAAAAAGLDAGSVLAEAERILAELQENAKKSGVPGPRKRSE
jgi:hypothetical protein